MKGILGTLLLLFIIFGYPISVIIKKIKENKKPKTIKKPTYGIRGAHRKNTLLCVTCLSCETPKEISLGGLEAEWKEFQKRWDNIKGGLRFTWNDVKMKGSHKYYFDWDSFNFVKREGRYFGEWKCFACTLKVVESIAEIVDEREEKYKRERREREAREEQERREKLRQKRQKEIEALGGRLDELTGEQFEALLEELFDRMGYSVKKTKASGDMGADLIITSKGGNPELGTGRIAVQAKRTSSTVGVKAIQEVVASLRPYNCDKGYVVTNSSVSMDAKQLAQHNDVGLIDGEELRKFLDKHILD